MRGRFLAISILGLLCGLSARAQRGAAKDTVIKGATIEIIQSYTPEVKRTPALPLFHHYRPLTLLHRFYSIMYPLRRYSILMGHYHYGRWHLH